MGIEFAYAAETAFVSPTLLKIGEKKSIKCSKRSHIIISCLGVSQSHMTLIWCLSPLVGFFLTPILGSLSDRYCIHILAPTGALEVIMSVCQCTYWRNYSSFLIRIAYSLIIWEELVGALIKYFFSCLSFLKLSLWQVQVPAGPEASLHHPALHRRGAGAAPGP